MEDIFISIKPVHLNNIISGKKNYEFRNYIPKKEFKYLYVYESSKECKFGYIIEISNIIKYPDKIDEYGIGNSEFNHGKKSKYAYKIKSVYKLNKFIFLEELKKKYNFAPPQSYAYVSTYKKLYNDIQKMDKTKII